MQFLLDVNKSELIPRNCLCCAKIFGLQLFLLLQSPVCSSCFSDYHPTGPVGRRSTGTMLGFLLIVFLLAPSVSRASRCGSKNYNSRTHMCCTQEDDHKDRDCCKQYSRDLGQRVCCLENELKIHPRYPWAHPTRRAVVRKRGRSPACCGTKGYDRNEQVRFHQVTYSQEQLHRSFDFWIEVAANFP